MDWLFCSNNSLAPKIVIVGLSHDFKVSKDMFEGIRDPLAHLMQYNDYMNVLRASNVAKCKAFSTTLKGSAKEWYLSLPQGLSATYHYWARCSLEEVDFQGRKECVRSWKKLGFSIRGDEWEVVDEIISLEGI
ncbi:hypothetical protein J1N35_036695 [Gossypium stocksii]|uniref:Retrotransposon gag domain-containing protein n=1 Tax=Gossypium stocksii TaxID=47602 RepID=A0A9D3UIS9_9ROSI|nr:hypothetical protein J1N35_036695 [Gossypium stocksii]